MARTVLIVDDVSYVRKTLSEILRNAHFEVVGEATNGEEAIEMYRKLHPDIVTMDVVMPKMSGIDATRKITRTFKGSKIVIVSAMGQENLVMDAINAGAKDYILKPFTAEEITKTLEHVLAGSDETTRKVKTI